MATTEYRRTPLPKYARLPLGWLVLCLMSLIFSPFAGFAIHGEVGTAGLAAGLWFALIPLSGLVSMTLLRWLAWRRLPPPIASEWTSGKIVPAEGAPAVAAPARFSDTGNWMEILPEGLAFSRSCLLSMPGVSEAMARIWVADNTGEMFIAWAEIAEWGVDIDSDGPDYHLLRLRPSGTVRVKRFLPDQTSECGLLDAVRSIGKVPVRLRCDVDCEDTPIIPSSAA